MIVVISLVVVVLLFYLYNLIVQYELYMEEEVLTK